MLYHNTITMKLEDVVCKKSTIEREVFTSFFFFHDQRTSLETSWRTHGTCAIIIYPRLNKKEFASYRKLILRNQDCIDLRTRFVTARQKPKKPISPHSSPRGHYLTVNGWTPSNHFEFTATIIYHTQLYSYQATGLLPYTRSWSVQTTGSGSKHQSVWPLRGVFFDCEPGSPLFSWFFKAPDHHHGDSWAHAGTQVRAG